VRAPARRAHDDLVAALASAHLVSNPLAAERPAVRDHELRLLAREARQRASHGCLGRHRDVAHPAAEHGSHPQLRICGPERELRLFGSFARGEAHEGSDVDVLVLVDGLTTSEFADAAGDVTAAVLETGLPLAPLPMATEKLAELRAHERLLARVLDEEGTPL